MSICVECSSCGLVQPLTSAKLCIRCHAPLVAHYPKNQIMTCRNCGRPIWNCRCFSKKEDVSFECWAVPNFHIFSSEDPQRIPRSVEIINGCMRELREFYWDCIEEAGVELNFDNSGKKWEKYVKWTNEKKDFYHQAIHILHYMRQVMAPHFICQDFDVKSYNKFIDIYESFVQYCQACLNSEDLDEINTGAYWEYMTRLFEGIDACFSNCLRSKK